MDFQDLRVYQISFALAMEVFDLSAEFPKHEQYSLTDQMRRSSRSVSTNIAEAYRKRRYLPHFISKLSDSDMENSETLVWLQFSRECGYITEPTFNDLKSKNQEIGKLLGYMIRNPKKFCHGH